MRRRRGKVGKPSTDAIFYFVLEGKSRESCKSRDILTDRQTLSPDKKEDFFVESESCE